MLINTQKYIYGTNLLKKTDNENYKLKFYYLDIQESIQ